MEPGNRFDKGPSTPKCPPGTLDEAQFWHRNEGAQSWDLMQGFPAWRSGDPNELFFPAPVRVKQIFYNGDVRTWDFKTQVEKRRARLKAPVQVVSVGYSYKELSQSSVPPVPPRQCKDDTFGGLDREDQEHAVEIPTEGESEVFA